MLESLVEILVGYRFGDKTATPENPKRETISREVFCKHSKPLRDYTPNTNPGEKLEIVKI